MNKLIKYSLAIVFIPFFLIQEGVAQNNKKEKGFKVLFDGKDMKHWTGNTTEYVLEDGNIVMRPKQEMGGNLYSKDTYSDFVLRFEFFLTPGANNGLGIRHDMVAANEGYSGMELQILDNEDPQYKDLKPYQYHGSLYGISPAKRGYLKQPGEWNTEEVIAKGDLIIVKINGTEILNTHINEAIKNLPEGSYAKAILNKSGHIAFLGHGSVVKFRNIRIKPL